MDRWAAFADIPASDPWCIEMIESERKGRSVTMVLTGGDAVAAKPPLGDGWMVARSISMETMLGYDLHLAIYRKYSRHA
jgi:hypothetical protein